MQSSQWLPVAVREDSSMGQDNPLLIRVGEACIEVKPGYDPAMLSPPTYRVGKGAVFSCP